ncbi:MAG: ACP S-malonyltransferase, partial [Actinomycetota bacterium]|nr:ACP S-malonyltransferase [Actinomycetota bacterium]
ARATFERASDRLGYDISARCALGPAEELTHTLFAQPAVFTCSAAWLAVLADRGLEPDLVAGHSVGEITALHAARALDFDEALDAVHHRAQLMAATPGHGTMAAVVGLDAGVVDRLCAEASVAGPVVVAVHNAPANVVVSGARPGVEAVVEAAKAAGAVRVVPLAVSHAFHSPLMAEAVEAWSAYVATLPLRTPRCPVALNVTGALSEDVDEIRQAVVDQLTGAVRWADCVVALRDGGATLAVEVGDSKALTGFVRSVDRGLHTVSLAVAGGLDQIEAAVGGTRAV